MAGCSARRSRWPCRALCAHRRGPHRYGAGLVADHCPGSGCHTHQGCHLAAAEMSQLGQVGDQHGGRRRPDTRYAAQQPDLARPGRMALEPSLEFLVQLGQIGLQPVQMGLDAGLYGRRGTGPTVCSWAHRRSAAAAGPRAQQGAPVAVGQRPHRRWQPGRHLGHRRASMRSVLASRPEARPKSRPDGDVARSSSKPPVASTTMRSGARRVKR